MGPIQRGIVKASLRSVRHPLTTLLLALFVLALCLYLAFTRLGISSDQNQLFSESKVYFRDYVRFGEKFPENEAIYVVVQKRGGAEPALERWIGIAEALAAKLTPLKQHVQSVEYRVPAEKLGAWGLLFADAETVRMSRQELGEFGKLIRKVAERPGIDSLVLGNTPVERFYNAMSFAETGDLKRSAGLVSEMTRSLSATIGTPAAKAAVVPPELERAEGSPRGLRYFYEEDQLDRKRNLLLVRVYERRDYTSLTAITETVGAIRGAVTDAARDYPEFHVGLTGRPVLEADEMGTSERDTRRSEIIAGITVFLGMILFLMPWSELAHAATWRDSIAIFLRGLWLALVAEISLAIAIGWTFGWAAVTVGRLNLLSLVFVIALIGIGMDYLVQVLTRYRREAARYQRTEAIWARVFRYVSPPISTACLGAAGAFLVSVLTPFRGAAELGIIAGGGLLLCLISGYTVLPAILTLLPPGLKMKSTAERYGGDRPPPRAGGWRLIFPLAWIVAVLGLTPIMRQVRFDPSLLDLQAAGLESVELVRHLETWYAVALADDLETLRKVRTAVLASKEVERTDSLLNAQDNAAYLQQHAATLPKIQWAQPQPVHAGKLNGLKNVWTRLHQHFAGMRDDAGAQEAAARLERLLAQVNNMPADDVAGALNRWQPALIHELRTQFRQADPPPLTDFRILPAEVRDHYVHYPRDGGKPTYALYIYPNRDLWDQTNLEKFVSAVEKSVQHLQTGVPRDARGRDTRNFVLTGIAPELYHTTEAIRESFTWATIYALVLIFVLVLLDLRNLSQTLVAISVLGLGLPMLLAIMGALSGVWSLAQFNLANFFGLPILIGAGHEYGVFMVHRYREVLHNPRRVWRPWDVSDRALLLCAFITSSSFAFLLLGQHRGMKSLGFVMAVGTGCIYLATIFVVRPILLWRLKCKGLISGKGQPAPAEITGPGGV